MIRGGGPDDQRAEIVEVSGEGRPLGPIGQRSNRPAAAAVGLVAVLGLVAFIGFVNRPPVRPVGPSPGPASPAPSPNGIFPATAGGLPVVGVSTVEALATNPSGASVELAVGGWYSAVRLVEACRPSSGPVGTCISDWQAVLESRPDVRWSNDEASHPIEPGTATISPLFIDPVAPPALAGSNAGGPLEIVAPSPLVLIGHVRDDRLCGEANGPTALCASSFVVDAVAGLDGSIPRAAGPAAVGSTKLTSASVVDLVRGRLQPGGFVLGFGALPWSVDVSAPPWVEPSGLGPPVDGRTVWLVRGYLPRDAGVAVDGGAIASWLAIDDETGQMWGPMATAATRLGLPAGFPTTVDGLPVEAVGDALPTAAGGPGVVAIGGFLSNDRAVDGCPPAPASDKPDPCSGTSLVLVDRPDGVLQANDATFLYAIVVPPGVPSIRPVVVPGTSVPDPWAAAAGPAARLESRPVVLVGRFGDSRSPECAARPGGGNAGCDRSFVIDQIAWIDGVDQGSSVYVAVGRQPTHTAGDVAAAVAGWFLPAVQPAVVSMTATLPAESARLTGLALDGRAAEVFWVVRVIGAPAGGPATSTFLVFDDRTLSLVEVSAAD